jgi:hypothetical protein
MKAAADLSWLYFKLALLMLRGKRYRRVQKLKSYHWISKSRNLRCPCTAEYDAHGRMIHPGQVKFKKCGCGLYAKAMGARTEER